MKQSPIIHKIIALALLFTFAISVAPKAWFHDIVANHKDVAACDERHNTTAIHTQSSHCHFDDLVVTSLFVPARLQSFTLHQLYFEKKQSAIYSSYSQFHVQHKESRGPPFLV